MAGFCAGVIGAVYPVITAHTGAVGLPCPLRALTTATVALTHGQWAAAAGTSPLAYLVAALVVATTPVLLARAAGMTNPPRPWSAATRRRTRYAVLVVVA